MREPMSDFAYSAVKSSGVSDTNNLILVGESDEQPPEFEPVLQPFDSQNLGDINNNDIHKHQPPPQQQHPSIMQIAADATPSSSPDNNIRMPQDSQILENVPPDKLLRFETHFSIPQAAQQSHSPPSTQQQQQQVQLQPPPQLQPQLHPNNKHQQQNQQVPQQAMQLPSPRQQQVHNQLYHPQPLQQPQIIAAQQLLQQHQQPQHQLKLQQQQQQQQQQQLHLPQAHLLGSNLSLVKKMGPPPPSPSYINSEDEYYSDASPDHDHDDNFGHGHHQSSFSKNKEVKKRKRFTKDEDDKITEGVNMYGTQSWDKIVSWSGLDRTKEQIANRYRRLAKHHPEWQHGHPHQPGTHYPHNGQFTGAPHHNHANASHNNNNNNNSFYNAPNYNYAHISHHNNNNPYNNLIVPTYSNSSSSSSSSMIAGVDGDVQSKPASLVSPMGIMGEEGIPRKESQSPIPPKVPSMPQVAINGGGPHTLTPQNQNQLQPQYRAPQLHELEKKEKELRDKELRLKKWEADLISAEGRLKQYEDQLRQLKLAQDSIAEAQKQNVRDMENKFKDILIEFLLRDAENERREDRRKLSANIIRLGHVTHSRKGMDLYEIWKDGEAFEDLKARQEAINQERERIEKAKKQLQKMKHTARPTSPADGHHARDLNNNNINGGYLSNDDEGSNAVLEQEEIYKLRLQALKKEEAYLLAEREKLEIEKSLHIKEIKRIREEDRSRFNNYQILNNGRYFLMKLLGKGGFSEVYKAYDLKEYRVVACKLHQLNAQWNDERKQNYIKHARREYEIHKRLDHPRVVRFYDVFEIDVNTFSTVLEYCEGPDLDLYLKKHKFLSEREARSIIVQVFAGLKYLNEQKQKIIHYDLKPANILFTADGHIKITDFGLSKILDEDSPDAVELTSQGAGTYWYLPPECFEVGKTPKISSKVDVWSAGVVFYQILYGRKPFGNDLSQNRILSEGTIINARQVEFPPKPVLSQEAKDFIRRCLAYNQEDRPDVLTIVNDPYLANGPPKK